MEFFIKHSSFRFSVVFIFVTLITAFIYAEDSVAIDTSQFPTIRFTADSRITDEISDSPVLDAETFAYMALVASGTSDEKIPAYLNQLQNTYASCTEMFTSQEDSERVEQTLHYLFTTVISTYEENQTRLDVALSDGIYNCVSSAIIFMYMMKKENIPVTAVETPMHAFCTVQIEGKHIDVETTNPWGFNPGVKKEVASDSLYGKKFVSVPAKKYNNRHDIDDRRIISIIYLNRIAALQKKQNEEAGIGLACDALKLQNNSTTAKDTVQKGVYNVAVKYTNVKRDREGISLIRIATSLFGDSNLYHQYTAVAVNNILNNCYAKNEYDEAVSLLESYKDLLDESNYVSSRNVTISNRLTNIIKTKSFDEAIAEIHLQQNILAQQNYTNLVTYAYSKEASKIAETGDWLKAISFCEQGLQEIPKNSTLVQQRAVYRRNYAIVVHNKAVSLFNAGDVEGAQKTVKDGLQIIEDSSILKSDLNKFQD